MALEMKYFVIKPGAKTKNDKFAQASQEAILKYAEFIEEVDLSLSKELTAWSLRESVKQARL